MTPSSSLRGDSGGDSVLSRMLGYAIFGFARTAISAYWRFDPTMAATFQAESSCRTGKVVSAPRSLR